VPDFDSEPRPPRAQTLSPFELLSVLWRRKAIVAVTVVVSVSISIVLAFRAPTEYGASAQLLFREPNFSQALLGNGLFQTGQEEPQRTTQTNIDVVTSPSVGAVAKELLHTPESVSSLLNSITVNPGANANLAVITATASTPIQAARVANAFANAYIDFRRENDRALIGQAEERVSSSLTSATAAERPRLEESLHQLRVLQAVQTGNGELIATAHPNSSPVAPRPTRDALFGLVVGLLLGCGLALLVDFLDQRLKTIDDVERAYGDYPVIASIPRINAGIAEPEDLAGPVGEAYRMLRESLRFLDPGGAAKCFMITSANESEGKSTVAVNLATALAAVDKSVILIEADMRRPTAARQLRVPTGTEGLSDYLISRSAIDGYLTTVSAAPGLRVLSGGTTPPNSADLLSTDRMDVLLEEARAAADVVIIDAPPILPVADTRVLLHRQDIDGTILVVRVGVSRRDRVRSARRVLEQSGRRVFGLVVTGVRVSPGEYTYYRYEPRAGVASKGGAPPPAGSRGDADEARVGTRGSQRGRNRSSNGHAQERPARPIAR
jgi:capsular exopolysaccharide synthesis family protein